MPPASDAVLFWWGALSLISLANVVGWVLSLRRARRDPERWTLALLSGGFVLGCAFRSFFPCSEAARLTLSAWSVSNAAVGRAVATLAELAFVSQCAIVLARLGKEAHVAGVRVVALFIVPLIALAEVFSWHSALTTNYLGSICEESLWAVVGTGLAASLWVINARGASRFTLMWALLTSLYVVFMLSIDIPMYWHRWRSDEQTGKTYSSWAAGWVDSCQRRVVSRSWADWAEEIPWMTFYFTTGVWFSLALVHYPRRAVASSDAGL